MGVAAPLFLGEDGGRVGGPEPKRVPPLRVVAGERGEDADPTGPISVLLVEDDPSMRLVCTFNLEAAGFHVVSATTGYEALEKAQAETFDVVLLDVMLPDMGGLDVATRISSAPIVFVSARTADTDLDRGREAGAIDYVTKPFDPVSLPERLREDLAELKRSGPDGVWELRHGTSGAE